MWGLLELPLLALSTTLVALTTLVGIFCMFLVANGEGFRMIAVAQLLPVSHDFILPLIKFISEYLMAGKLLEHCVILSVST